MASDRGTRDARRRNILRRGPDRLAFITGESSCINLPPVSSSPTEITRADGDGGTHNVVERGSAASIHSVDGLASAQSADFEAFRDSIGFEDLRDGNGRSPSIKQRSAEEKDLSMGIVKSTSFPLTWGGVDCSIEVTQTSRAFGAVFVALILAAQRCSILVSLNTFARVDHMKVPWPLAVILISDVFLVVGALLLGLAGPRGADLPDVPQQDQSFQLHVVSNQLAALVLAMRVILKGTKALFLDCSIYVVVVICSHSITDICGSPF